MTPSSTPTNRYPQAVNHKKPRLEPQNRSSSNSNINSGTKSVGRFRPGPTANSTLSKVAEPLSNPFNQTQDSASILSSKGSSHNAQETSVGAGSINLKRRTSTSKRTALATSQNMGFVYASSLKRSLNSSDENQVEIEDEFELDDDEVDQIFKELDEKSKPSSSKKSRMTLSSTEKSFDQVLDVDQEHRDLDSAIKPRSLALVGTSQTSSSSLQNLHRNQQKNEEKSLTGPVTFDVDVCYDSAAHGCVQSGPVKLSGLQSKYSVAKLLRAFCRDLKVQEQDLGAEVDSLAIGKCSHSSPHRRQTSSILFSRNDSLGSIDLREGDNIFVMRVKDVEGGDEKIGDLANGNRSGE